MAISTTSTGSIAKVRLCGRREGVDSVLRQEDGLVEVIRIHAANPDVNLPLQQRGVLRPTALDNVREIVVLLPILGNAAVNGARRIPQRLG